MGTQYVLQTELPNYINALALASIPVGVQNQACIDASETADSYLRGRFPLPLLTFGTDLKRYTAYIAIKQMLVARGVSQDGDNQTIWDNYFEAVGGGPNRLVGWFPAVQRGAIEPDVTVNAPGPPTYTLPQVYTSPPRGW
jgi:phage gp36-like protein